LQELDTREASIAEIASRIAQCAARLTEVQDSCEELAETLRAKAGGGSGQEGEEMGGGSVVARLKQALVAVKAEIKNMSTSTALLNMQLLAQRKQQISDQRSSNRLKTTQRSAKLGSTAKPIVDDDDLFYDSY
jgi:hypothetical protein